MQSSATKKLILLVILAAVVVGVAYLLAGKGSKEGATDQSGQKNEVAFERSELSKIKSDKKELLEGLPSDLPVDSDKVVDKYSVDYPDLNATQYTITSNTDLTAAKAYEQYLDYMTKAGFDFTEGSKNPPTSTSSGYISATKNNDDMSVSISSGQSGIQVQITYLDRK